MLKLPFGLKEEKLVEISQVERGLACNCFCPSCGEKLIARKGESKIDHFAHYQTKECAYGLETALHMAAKEILNRHKVITIPPEQTFIGEFQRIPTMLNAQKNLQFDKVYLEKRLENIIPDIIIEINGKPIMIEIYVNHRIDEEKLKKIKKLNISTIEINLSKYDRQLSMADLEIEVLYNIENKKWIYNSNIHSFQYKISKYNRRIKVIELEKKLWVTECPLPESKINCNSIAYIHTQCFECKYCKGLRRNTFTDILFLTCAGSAHNVLDEIISKSNLS